MKILRIYENMLSLFTQAIYWFEDFRGFYNMGIMVSSLWYPGMFIPPYQLYVGGKTTPLKNDGVRQMGWWHWWHSQDDGKNNSHVPNHRKQYVGRPLPIAIEIVNDTCLVVPVDSLLEWMNQIMTITKPWKAVAAWGSQRTW